MGTSANVRYQVQIRPMENWKILGNWNLENLRMLMDKCCHQSAAVAQLHGLHMSRVQCASLPCSSCNWSRTEVAITASCNGIARGVLLVAFSVDKTFLMLESVAGCLQLVYGLEHLVEVTVAKKIPAAAAATTLVARLANNVIGGENFIDMARWTGIQ